MLINFVIMPANLTWLIMFMNKINIMLGHSYYAL